MPKVADEGREGHVVIDAKTVADHHSSPGLPAGARTPLQRRSSVHSSGMPGSQVTSAINIIGGSVSMSVFRSTNFENVRMIDKVIMSKRHVAASLAGTGSVEDDDVNDDEGEVQSTSTVDRPVNLVDAAGGADDVSGDGATPGTTVSWRSDVVERHVTAHKSTSRTVVTQPVESPLLQSSARWSDHDVSLPDDWTLDTHLGAIFPNDDVIDATVNPVVVDGCEAYYVLATPRRILAHRVHVHHPAAAEVVEQEAASADDIDEVSGEQLSRVDGKPSRRRHQLNCQTSSDNQSHKCPKVPTQSGSLSDLSISGDHIKLPRKFMACPTSGRVFEVSSLVAHKQDQNESGRRLSRGVLLHESSVNDLSPAPCPFQRHRKRFEAGLEQLRTAQNLDFMPPMPRPPALKQYN